MDFLQIYVVLAVLLNCNEISSRKIFISRRFSGPGQSMIIGAPRYPQHLPPAEPILPGHTLIRPSIEMLKSSVKFPHREQENGSGVYGNIENLGIKYDGKNERVLYTKFRRSLPEDTESIKLPINNSHKATWRHLEMPAKSRNKLVGYGNPYGDNPSVNKVLTIYAAVPVNTRPKPIRLQNEKKSPLRYLENKIPVYFIRPNHYNHKYKLNEYEPPPIKKSNKNFPVKTLAMESIDGTQLLDFLWFIKSLRRDQDIQQLKHVPKKYVPGTAGYGKFSFSPLNSDEDESKNKTAMFWKTKGQFNHVKIDADAPDQTDFLPTDQTNQERQWWFYHQSDFEQFADK